MQLYPHALIASLLLAATPAIADTQWKGNFETGDLSQWKKAEMVSADRLKVVNDPVTQGKYALKVTVKQGDNPINASGNRAELVNTELQPEGSEAYYRWQTMFDPSYPTESTWQVFTQWHHNSCCGSPPVEFDIYADKIRLDQGNTGKTLWEAPLVRGVWHDFVFHVKWSEDPKVGFVELWYDGKLVLKKTAAATGHDTYLKQGLYRNSTISKDGIVYHDGMVKGATYDDVVPPPVAEAPPADGGTSTGGGSSGGGSTGGSGTGTGSSSGTGSTSSGSTRTSQSTASATDQGGGGCSTSGGSLSLIALAAAGAGLVGLRRRRTPAAASARRV